MSQPILKTACVIAAGSWQGDVCLFKNRDRSYVPDIRVYHQILNGVEVLYMKDETTGWCEGLNEYGIGMINSALAVVDDEKAKDIAKGEAKPTANTMRDGERVLAALQEKTLTSAVKTLRTYKTGLRGHTLLSDGDKLISLEATWRGHGFHQSPLPSNNIHVRTNHGLYHEGAGYTEDDGASYLSSMVRRSTAQDVLNGVEDANDIGAALMNARKKDRANPNNVVRITGMRTTSQMLLNLTQLEMTVYLLPDQVKFLGVQDDIPKGTDAKLKLKVIEFGSLDKKKVTEKRVKIDSVSKEASRISRVAALYLQSGVVVPFPGNNKPTTPSKVHNTHLIPIQGEKYFLSTESGFAGDLLEELSPGEDPNPRVIRGPQTDPWKFLWVYDEEKDFLTYWRVTDGNEKGGGRSFHFTHEMPKLEKKSELNRVSHAQYIAIDHHMKQRAQENLTALKLWVDDMKDDYQRVVDKAAFSVFDTNFRPLIKKALQEVNAGVVPFWFKTNPDMLEHKSSESQLKTAVLYRILDTFTSQVIDDAVRKLGYDPDAPDHDIQASYWARNDVLDAVYKEFKEI